MSLSILLTGADSPNGKATLRALLTKGHKVWAGITGSTHKDKGLTSALMKEVAGLPGELLPITLSLGDPDTLSRTIERFNHQANTLDVLINMEESRGIQAPLEQIGSDTLQHLMATNVIAPMQLINQLLPKLRTSRSGLIIHTSAMAAACHLPLSTPYATSKLAAERLLEGYRQELAPLGIDCLLLQSGALTSNPSQVSPGSHYQHLHAVKPHYSVAQASTPDRQAERSLASAVMALIESPRGSRPFRTVVAGHYQSHAEAINQAHEDSHSHLLHQLDLLQSLELAPLST